MDQAIIAKIGEYNQLSLRISSLDQKQAKGGIPQRERVPSKKAVFVIGTCFGVPSIKEKIIEIQNKGYDATNKEMGQLESLKVCLEATARGIKFLPVDLNNSNATVWGVRDDKSIYPPFASIEGLGDTVAKDIVEERGKRDFLSIEEVQYRAKVSGTLIEKMKSMGIFNGMSESNQLSLFD